MLIGNGSRHSHTFVQEKAHKNSASWYVTAFEFTFMNLPHSSTLCEQDLRFGYMVPVDRGLVTGWALIHNGCHWVTARILNGLFDIISGDGNRLKIPPVALSNFKLDERPNNVSDRAWHSDFLSLSCLLSCYWVGDILNKADAAWLRGGASGTWSVSWGSSETREAGVCLAFREQQNNSNQELSRRAKNISGFTTLPSKLFV